MGYGAIKLDQNITIHQISSVFITNLSNFFCIFVHNFIKMYDGDQCLKNGRKLSAVTFINNSQAQSVKLTLEVMILKSLLN